MKKVYLQEISQNNETFYSMVADPKIIAKLIQNVDPGKEQDNQRPWNESRVKEVARYVAGKFKDDENKKSKGLIPNSPIINITKNIEKEEDADGYYIMLPEKKSEIEQYKESIEIIDGQHRVRAFMERYLDTDLNENTKYDMLFTVFFQMPKKLKQEVFMITNEKQVKVPANLLRLFKKELDLLKGDEVIYELDVKLNEEDYSPLKGRIIIGAKNIPKGYQEVQIAKIIDKSGTYKMLSARNLDTERMCKIISNYLTAWEKSYGVSFQEPQNDTLTKISGLRYVFYLLPACMDILIRRKATPTIEEFKKIVDMLPAATDIDDVFTNEYTTLSFRGEGATTQLAKEHGLKLKTYDEENEDDYDIFKGI